MYLPFVFVDDSSDDEEPGPVFGSDAEDVPMPFDPEHEPEHDDAEDPMPFAGDFFGDDYVEADFDWMGDQQDAAEIWDADGTSLRCSRIDHWLILTNEKPSDESSDEEEADDEEDQWEPEIPVHAELPPDVLANPRVLNNEGHHTVDDAFSPAQRRDMEEALHRPARTVPFPIGTAGKPLPNREVGVAGYKRFSRLFRRRNPWAPFQSRIDWAVARWAKLRGPGSNAFTELLKIEGVSRSCAGYMPWSHILQVPEALGLSYRNSTELNKLIDEHIPGHPRFRRREIVVGGEAFEVYFRDVIECIRALYGDTEFARYLVFVPEQHYVDDQLTIRLYHDMHTGDWWWDTQVRYYLIVTPCTY